MHHLQITNTNTPINNTEVFVIEMKHSCGTKATITNYGAIIMKYEVVNTNNELQDIVLGFGTVVEYNQPAYRAAYPYFGAIIGRCANRIKDGAFTLNNTTYQLAQNLTTNNLHGGNSGFDSKVWTIINHGTLPYPFVVLQYISPHLEEGFPGQLTTTVTYTLLNNELQYTIEATTTATTIVNMAQHTYFNLNEDTTTNILQHIVTIPTTQYLEQDTTQCPTGKYLSITNTEYDFAKAKKIIPNNLTKDDLINWNGYDVSFILPYTNNELNLAAICTNNTNTITLQVYTTQPIVHLYTGKWIPKVIGKYNVPYGEYSGVCFETQQHPNGINIPTFPTTILNPSEQYWQMNSYKVI